MRREEKITLSSDGLQLRGCAYWPTETQAPHVDQPLLILCHGIPGAASKESSGTDADGGYPALARCCLEQGFAVFHFNFRGAGESEGNFDLAGWRRDLNAVLNYWEKERGKKNFLLWGFSAGAAVSCCVAACDSRVKGVIMAASPAEFFSIFPARMLEQLLAGLRQRGIIRERSFPRDPAGWLREIHATSPLPHIRNAAACRPLLIIHGSRDELVPWSHAFQLYKAAGRSAQLVIQPAAGHQLRRYPAAVQRCLRWLLEVGVPESR